MALICSVLVIAHIVIFLIANAWPVAIFLGADLFLLFGAFWLNYRSGRVREEITVTRIELSVKKVAASGKARVQTFNPIWTKFNVSRHEEIGITDMKVAARGAQASIGSFLNPDDRESFAREFSGALALAKKN